MQTINLSKDWRKIELPESVSAVLANCKSVIFASTRDRLLSLAVGGKREGIFEVAYDVPGTGRVVEATVAVCKNGLAVNYVEPYMRRRDPECLVVGDDKPTDKNRFIDLYGEPFSGVRDETFDWLKRQNLVVMVFMLGNYGPETGRGALLIAHSAGKCRVFYWEDWQTFRECFRQTRRR